MVKNASASISKAIANTAATAAAATRKTNSPSTAPIEIKTSPSGAKTASSLKQIASTASKTLSAIYNDVKKTIVTVSNSVKDQVSPPKKGLNNTQSILSKYEIIDISPEMRGKLENPLNKESTSFGHAVCGKVFNDTIGSGKILAGKLINQAIGQKPMAGVDAFAYIREPANDLIRSGMANLQKSAELKEKVAGNNIAEGFIFDSLCFITDLGVSAAIGGGAKLISNKLAQSVTKSSLKKAVTSQIDDVVAKGAGKTDNFISNNVPKQFQTQVKTAFDSDAKVTTLKQDTIVYRYYGGDSAPSSYWVTPTKTSNPVSDLALPPCNTAQHVDSIVLKKGTTVLEGTVAPNFGQSGGGYQYYVPGMR